MSDKMVNEQKEKVSAWLSTDAIHDIKVSGETMSDYVRDAVDLKRARENSDFIDEKIRSHEFEIKQLQKQRELLGKKKTDLQKIPVRERDWLIKTKKILEEQPHFTDGRIQLYINTFPKQYKVTKEYFFKLMQEAQNQAIEAQALSPEVKQ